MHIEFLSENHKGRDSLEDLDVGGEMIIQWIIKKKAGSM
jgi:hypothetical protein